MTISENCKRYQYFNFEIDFLESKNRFQKSGAAFLVEDTSIQSCIISIQSCHTSEANVKTNEMVNTKCTTKNGVLLVTTLFFWKFCFNLRTSYKEFICCTSNPNVHIFTFCKRGSFIWRCFFPMNILKNTKCHRFFFHLFNTKRCAVPLNYYPVDTRRRFSVYKTSIRRRRRCIEVL